MHSATIPAHLYKASWFDSDRPILADLVVVSWRFANSRKSSVVAAKIATNKRIVSNPAMAQVASTAK
jgi:hypothetical protein